MISICKVIALALTIVIPVGALSAQDEPQKTPETAVEEPASAPATPIIVRGDKGKKRVVMAGSRLPQKPTYDTPSYATNTGGRGLVPGSGMDPYASVRRVRVSECKSDNPAIGKRAACLLIETQYAIDAQDYGVAHGLLGHLSTSDEYSAEEKLAGAQWQYRLAKERGDAAIKEQALEQMVDTGAMKHSDEIRARRALAAMALNSGERVLARERLEELDQMDGLDTKRLANLAILMREQEVAGSSEVMQRAIDRRLERGRKVPQSWLDFVEPTSP